MKKFKITLLALLLMLPLVNFAQVSPINIEYGEISKERKKDSEILYTTSDDNGGTLMLKVIYGGFNEKPKGYYIEHYDNKLNLKNKKEIEIDHNIIKNILVEKGKVHLVEYYRNRDTKNYDYNILTANLSDFNFTSKTLFSIDRKDIKKAFSFSGFGIGPAFAPAGFGIGYFSFNNDSKIDHDPTGEVRMSSNNNYMAFNFDIKNDDNETHRIIVYNKNLEQVYDQTFSNEKKDKYFQYNSFTVSDDDGSVYFIGKSYKNNTYREIVKGKINYEFKIYKLNEKGVNEVSLGTDEKHIKTLEILIKEDKVHCVGTYSERDDDLTKGVVYYQLNSNDLQVNSNKFNPFTEQYMVDKYGEKRGKRKNKKGKEVGGLTYRSFFIGENDNIYFTAEEYFIIRHIRTAQQGMMTIGQSYSYSYHFNDISICKLNSNGEVQWLRTINKAQTTQDPKGYLSFSSLLNQGKLYLFLNGAENVAKMKDDRIRFRDTGKNRMNLYAIEVDPSGNFEYEIIIDDKASKMTYKPSFGVISQDNESLLLEGNKGKDKQLIRLSL